VGNSLYIANHIDLKEWKKYLLAKTNNRIEAKFYVENIMADNEKQMTQLLKDKIENESSIKTPRLLTAALGLGSETGEFVEIVKKMILQGKPADEDNIFHMKRELGDVMWYWVTACMALDLDPVEVISENQKKILTK
jgi:NTP pyrophosphatase (non-canonical NTP hydrolase)